jgi:hypothetical protein
MNIARSYLSAIKMTPWFVKASWRYVVTKRLSSKVEFFIGIIPAWARFTVMTYKYCRQV